MTQMYNGSPVVQNTDVTNAINSLLPYLQRQLANGYSVVSLDLGTARTDELIASNVVSFTVLSVDSGATASVKLFDTGNDAISIPNDLDVGDSIADLDGADLYFTNTAQSGYTVKLLVFTRS